MYWCEGKSDSGIACRFNIYNQQHKDQRKSSLSRSFLISVNEPFIPQMGYSPSYIVDLKKKMYFSSSSNNNISATQYQCNQQVDAIFFFRFNVKSNLNKVQIVQESFPVGCIPPVFKPYMHHFHWPQPDVVLWVPK